MYYLPYGTKIKDKCENQICFCITSILIKTASKLHNVGIKKGKLNWSYAECFIYSSILAERNISTLIAAKSRYFSRFAFEKSMVGCGSSTNLQTTR